MADDGGFQPERGIKKRRLHGACDMCRKKKVKCDSANMPGNVCSNCIMFNSECTHVLANSRKRAVKKPVTPNFQSPGSSYLSTPSFSGLPEAVNVVRDTPSSRRELTESVLSASYIFPEELSVAHNTIFELATYARSLEQQLTAAPNSPGSVRSSESGPSLPSPSNPSSSDEYEDEKIQITIGHPMRQMTINNKTVDSFFGKTSDMVFIKSALDAKAEYSNGAGASGAMATKRSEFWSTFPWQFGPELLQRPLEFPSPELTSVLIRHYFEDYHHLFPILHRQIFEKQVANGRHRSDSRFGLLLLSICAIGSRFVDLNDPRMLEEGVLDPSEAETTKKHSLGWKWFRQIGYRAMNVELPSATTLPDVCELQLIINYIMFAQPTTAPDMCWLLLGQGVRYAFAVGVHRKSFRGGPASVSSEKELWKRAFWGLVVIDVFMSAFLGRPRATNPAECDIEFPVDCDDEYWDHADPELNFKQPPTKPSTISAYIRLLKLLDIYGFAQRSLFAVRKSSLNIDIPLASEQEDQIVNELDKALNEWVDETPDHLRWNPHMYKDNKYFFNQAAALYVNYYWVQIHIHRTFIRGRGARNREKAFTSLAVCANAARSSTRLMDVQNREGDLPVPFPGTQMVLFNSAIVLLLKIWGGKSSGLATDPHRDLSDVHTSVRVLKTYEERWQIAGRLCDILTELISFSEIAPAPASREANSLKRPRSDFIDDPHDPQESTESSAVVSLSSGSDPQWEETFPSGLPLYAEDLGRLPLHGSIPDLSGGDNSGDDAAFWANFLAGAPTAHTGSSWPQMLAAQGGGQGGNNLNGTALATWSGTPGEYGWA
ncbi:Gypsy retrotransposon integrase-like protein 1 [Marasmius sp. AFHP31]|nr:Gypsy retrotransposon integrase-like protein 1 [Marasmius sp. AFHP31]